jgi:hypothetical protein
MSKDALFSMMESTCLGFNEFPQDQISELMANATGFSFSMSNLLDTTKDASFLVLEERATTVCTMALIHQLTNF